VRGQVTIVTGGGGPEVPCAWGGYAAPTRAGWLFGATHDRDDASDEPRMADDLRNLETLREIAPGSAARAEAAAIKGRAGVRAVTRDRMPVAGRLSSRVFVLAGLGSRGFLTAPLLAEHVVAEAMGSPSPIPASAARLVAPDRPGIEFA
jgi:tRNA 5-methylaminomethyl-2-thiouridine biosynthesis bifunctional protein